MVHDTDTRTAVSRRNFLRTGAALAIATQIALPTGAQAQSAGTIRRRISGFSTHRWQNHFSSIGSGKILVDTQTRSLHYWAPGFYKIYPTSVPLSESLTKRGRTSVVQKRVGPDWRPTANMLRRDPTLPRYVGPGPDNPLGTHALYLGWTYYRIHGTNDTRKIGRQSSNGCIGLYNEDIADLFGRVGVGTQVRVI
ncbi:L,D-transpeptidase [Oceanomicrobium pacificus]|uniref:L,D-transpeptidase family protein n=1 Tax=Oceanomicrobium pacificus TaxID=2692916 RepID=A0A6B0TJQ1_9RHOB|nr:L,D-transpeptidase [Oceanomicrobium pacificus]MXU64667.1 L,D-transpeptidase family protein [Oceanomicrobium pacificus]